MKNGGYLSNIKVGFNKRWLKRDKKNIYWKNKINHEEMTYKTLHNKENRIKIAKVKMLGTQREINDMKTQA